MSLRVTYWDISSVFFFGIHRFFINVGGIFRIHVRLTGKTISGRNTVANRLTKSRNVSILVPTFRHYSITITLTPGKANTISGFATKLNKFQKSKKQLDRAQPTHPSPYAFFVWKIISDTARTLKFAFL